MGLSWNNLIDDLREISDVVGRFVDPEEVTVQPLAY